MKKKILVVDDEITIVELLTVALQLKGFEVLYAMDARQGLQQTFQYKPDLIIIDIMLPGESGLSLYEKLKASSLADKIPVIFLTALNRKQVEASYPDLNEIVIFKKPWDINELTATIQRMLGASSG